MLKGAFMGWTLCLLLTRAVLATPQAHRVPAKKDAIQPGHSPDRISKLWDAGHSKESASRESFQKPLIRSESHHYSKESSAAGRQAAESLLVKDVKRHEQQVQHKHNTSKVAKGKKRKKDEKPKDDAEDDGKADGDEVTGEETGDKEADGDEVTGEETGDKEADAGVGEGAGEADAGAGEGAGAGAGVAAAGPLTVAITPAKFYAEVSEPLAVGVQLWGDKANTELKGTLPADMQDLTFYQLAKEKGYKGKALEFEVSKTVRIFVCSDKAPGKGCGYETSLLAEGFAPVPGTPGDLMYTPIFQLACYFKDEESLSFSLPAATTDICHQLVAMIAQDDIQNGAVGPAPEAPEAPAAAGAAVAGNASKAGKKKEEAGARDLFEEAEKKSEDKKKKEKTTQQKHMVGGLVLIGLGIGAAFKVCGKEEKPKEKEKPVMQKMPSRAPPPPKPKPIQAVATELAAPAEAEATNLHVADIAGFADGDEITIGEEEHVVTGTESPGDDRDFGSILLQTPLENSYPVGTAVTKKDWGQLDPEGVPQMEVGGYDEENEEEEEEAQGTL